MNEPVHDLRMSRGTIEGQMHLNQMKFSIGCGGQELQRPFEPHDVFARSHQTTFQQHTNSLFRTHPYPCPLSPRPPKGTFQPPQ